MTLVALLAGCAAQADVPSTAAVGRVTGVYVERYAGVYVERSVAPHRADQPLWVQVALDKALPDGRASVIAMAHADAGVEQGDLVQIKASEAGWHLEGSAPAVTHVTAVVAKRGSEMALSFGKRIPSSPIDKISQAEPFRP